MKLKISRVSNEQPAGPKVCVACNGSGYYDYTDARGRQPKCAACNGTGYER